MIIFIKNLNLQALQDVKIFIEKGDHNKVFMSLQPGEGVTIPSDPLVGCDCEDCSTNKKCCATQMGSWAPYNKAGRVKVKLT